MQECKYPRAVCGVFVFNERGELFLMKSPKWENQYICPGGTIELNEKIIDTAVREVKEETNMDIYDVEFLEAVDGVKLGDSYSKPIDHLIFLDHKAKVKSTDSIKLNDEGTKYKWLKPEKWLKNKNLEKFTRRIIEKHLLNTEDEQAYKSLYLRALADYENLQKQIAAEKSEFAKYVNANLISELLPILDNFESAFTLVPEEEKNNSWVVGLQYIKNQMEKFLTDNGVEKIKTVGEKFNPEFHEAVESEDFDKSQKEDIVLKEIKAGYKLYEKVIQAAKVVVNKKNER